MAVPGGGIELPIYTKIDGREIELGTMTIPISTRVEEDPIHGAVIVVTVAPEDEDEQAGEVSSGG